MFCPNDFIKKKSFLQKTVFLKYLISIYFSIHLSVSIQLHTSKLCIRQPGPHKESHCYPSKIYFDLSLKELQILKFIKKKEIVATVETKIFLTVIYDKEALL